MSESVLVVLNAAVLRLLRPLVRVLLRHGLPYGAFAELARKAYVEEGFELVRATGKRPTVSSVSALTGLTRKEASRLRDLDIVDAAASSKRYSRAIRVISGWISDSRFQTGAGVPAVLPLEGEQGSFAALVKAYSGDITSTAMLSLLEHSDTVTVDEHGVTLQARAYVPSSTPAEKLDILGTDVAELIDTIDHNLQADTQDRLFQRKVSNVRLHPDALPEFRQFSNRKSQQLLEEYHQWLRNHQVNADNGDDIVPVSVSVGIYFFEQTPAGEEAS